ncbi:divergent polysaccharide deacetylase family protein [Ferruginivarius sediminum]|uniref:divergent polysaccharide deacetylase family protein n=1 Tax=Ferruginivarius sediminum TaxID=2661937 RepID=UPI001379F68D|nr:divergent polysaccharide deacetylase family protein [Ferruginivarius sediminum]
MLFAWILLAIAVAAGAVYVFAFPHPDALVAHDKTIRLSVPPAETAEPVSNAPSPVGETEKKADVQRPSGNQPTPEASTGVSVGTLESEAIPPPPVPEQTSARESDSQDTPAVRTTDTDSTEAGAGGGEGAAESPSAPTLSLKPAWKRYARGLAPPQGLPRIAVVVRGLGLSSAATEAAIERLPGTISLSFTPYARRAAEWSARARAGGHEVLMDLPMEPRDFPALDPGPQALMTEAAQQRNLDRLDWALSRGREVVGAVAQMGSRFMASKQAAEPIMRELRARGLMFVDNGTANPPAALRIARRIDLPHALNDRTIDDGQVSRPAVEARLVEIERIAQQEGLAVALAHPYPVVLDLLATWSQDLDERGFALVPITEAVQPRSAARAGR